MTGCAAQAARAQGTVHRSRRRISRTGGGWALLAHSPGGRRCAGGVGAQAVAGVFSDGLWSSLGFALAFS